MMEPAVGAWTWASGSQVWDLDRKGQGKRQEAQHLERGSGGGRQGCGNLGNGEGSGLDEDGHNRDQHQSRTQQRVHDELQGGVDPVLAAPLSNQEVHRDQRELEEGVEQHQILG